MAATTETDLGHLTGPLTAASKAPGSDYRSGSMLAERKDRQMELRTAASLAEPKESSMVRPMVHYLAQSMAWHWR